MRLTLLERILEARRAKVPIVLITDLASGEQQIVEPFADSRDRVTQAAREAAISDRSAVLEDDGRRLFLNVLNPPLRLIIIGAVHIAQPLAHVGRLCGYQVVVCDPRGAFATAERFPDFELITRWPDEALTALTIDRRCAIVTLTHDPKLDDPALQIALRTEAFYIGALGSKKTQAARRSRLAEQGFSEDLIDRIRGPVGLDIGAKSPAEVAISIMAQITAALRIPVPA